MPDAAKLLFVITSSDFGGTESFLERLLGGLDRDRFSPEVCSLCPPGRIAQSLAESGVPLHSFDMAPRARPHEMLSGAFRLARLIRRGNFALVQSLLYRANVLAAVAKYLTWQRPPLVTGQRSLIPAGRGQDARAQRWTRSWADRVVAVSEAVRDELLATEKIDAERVVVIQNGIDIERFSPRGNRHEVRAAWQVTTDTVTVGAVGRLHGPKGLKYLIEAIAIARRRGTELVLVLVGSGPEERMLRQQVAALELGDQVRFLGYQQDPSSLFAGFDIYALPSLAEGSPNALLEAMGCGCAAVASAVGGVPEAVGTDAGLLVPAADSDALAAALERLAADPEQRAQLAARARLRVQERFDIRGMIRRHEELYASLLNGDPQGDP